MLFKTAIAAVITLTLWIGAVAQEKKDPFDLSATEKLTKELGVPTVDEVDKLETKARELYAANNYALAIPALEEYARKANWLSNLIAAELEPYYSASYDSKKSFPPPVRDSLAPIEERANSYKKKRNAAMVLQAECLIKTGNKEKAASVLVRALDIITLGDPVWPQARALMHSLVGL